MKSKRILKWLSQDPHDSKHTESFYHPLIICILHYMIIYMTVFAIHDLCFFKMHSTIQQTKTSKGLMMYVVFLYTTRLYHSSHCSIQQNAVIYEFTWLCNTTLFMSSIALYCHRPLIAISFCVAVSIDQVLWYVDVLGYWIRYEWSF